ncbi:YmfQ family protein [Ampullimonas aquatilis]|uniref:YmfQ family protein n=1 Tax=Ampullimonas aquatilis TaxID=1341549 RepID=UPI003C72D8F4
MALSADDYLNQLQQLLPRGPAWPRDADARLTKLLSGWSQEYARESSRADDLLNESDPRSTNQLLSDFERVYGLPDACMGSGQSTTFRRSALLSKATSVGGNTKTYFIALAAALGYTITITEFQPFLVNSRVNARLYSRQWRFAWQVNSSLNTVRVFRVNGRVNERLAEWSNVPLECTINRLKPAHTIVLFSYT